MKQFQKPKAQYFQQKKKGQMNEIKNSINNFINDNDIKKGRQVIRKVVGYMTLGMDASPIFSQMCRASFINDDVMKKMIYFYLTTYAQDNADLAIMAINTFKKDCQHTNPKIRGLALRYLCSFKSSDYVGNVLPVIIQHLNDFEPYVKKTAIMGVLKVFYTEPQQILNEKDESIINTLSHLIKDTDPLVSTNALLALDEILVSEGGINLNSKLYFYLLHRLRDYNEWQQTNIIEILYRYQPQNQKQHYQIMNVLWDKLKSSCTPLVLGSIKIILKLAKEKEDLFKTVVEKIKAPILTLMTGNQNTGTFETTFIVLSHIDYVITHMQGKTNFQKDFKYFYCKADEPTYIKSLKVSILGKLANQYNLGDLLNQFNQYASDIDIEMARNSVRVLTEIALRLPQVSKALMINMISFYKMEKQHLSNQVVISFYKILRKYPKLFSDVGIVLVKFRAQIIQNQSIKAFIWICGTFSHLLEESPYILEEYIDNEDQFHNLPTSLKQLLLTQTLTTFLKRPVQTQKILSKIFKLIFHNPQKSSISLLDHASFYYQSLKDNVQEVKKAFSSMENDMVKCEEYKGDVHFEEDFNSLSMIYCSKESKFCKSYQYFVGMRNKELGLGGEKEDEEEEQDTDNGDVTSYPQNPFQSNNDQVQEITQILPQDLTQQQSLTPQQFQNAWNTFTAHSTQTYQIINEQILDEQSIEELFKTWYIFTTASAEQQDGQLLKFYLYGKHEIVGYACMEIVVNKIQKNISVTSKAKNQGVGELWNLYVRELLVANQFME